MSDIPDIVCHGELRNRSSRNISHPGKNVSRVVGKMLEVFFAGDPAEHKHGDEDAMPAPHAGFALSQDTFDLPI